MTDRAFARLGFAQKRRTIVRGLALAAAVALIAGSTSSAEAAREQPQLAPTQSASKPGPGPQGNCNVQICVSGPNIDHKAFSPNGYDAIYFNQLRTSIPTYFSMQISRNSAVDDDGNLVNSDQYYETEIKNTQHGGSMLVKQGYRYYWLLKFYVDEQLVVKRGQIDIPHTAASPKPGGIQVKP